MSGFEKIPKGIFDKVESNKELFISEFKEKLEDIFPSTVKDGIVDFEALLNEFGKYAETDEKEKYNMTWVGKKDAIRKANEDIVGKTLKYVPEDSKNPETTQNLYIEGDNLEVLKLLRNSYYGKVKMIYIDPPYNTGNDFIYNDNFSISEAEYEKLEGTINDIGEKLVVNQKSTGRFHSKWLSMMYSRLKIAKDLLSNDGVIFISIDDNELANLKSMCDENTLFGENNFINIISAKMKNIAGASGGGEDKRLKKNIEYILVYAKNYLEFNGFEKVYNYTEIEELLEQYKNEDKSWKYTSVLINPGKKVYVKSTVDGDGNEIKIYRRENPQYASINKLANENRISIGDTYKKYFDDIFTTAMPQSSIRRRVLEVVKDELFNDSLYSIEYVPKSGKNKGEVYEQFYKGEKMRLFTWFKDVAEIIDGKVYKKDMQGTLWDGINLNNLTKEGSVSYNNGKKPLDLMDKVVSMVKCENEDIIMDFFAGSSSTAHAVINNNLIDGRSRRFIMVQIDEDLDMSYQKTNGDNKKTIKESINFLDSIDKPHILSELGKERIRRAGEKILEENKDKEEIEKLDIGFKVFKVADTNIRWISDALRKNISMDDYRNDMSLKDQLDFNTHFTDIDVVYEMILKRQDIELTERIDKLNDIGGRTYLVAYTVLVCLEEEITEEMVKKISEIDTSLSWIVFRDSAFGDDINLKTNTMTLLRRLIKEKNPANKNQRILWI